MSSTEFRRSRSRFSRSKISDAHIAQGFERTAVAAFGAQGAPGHSPQAAQLPRKKRSNLISFTQAVSSKDDGFRFAQRHSDGQCRRADKAKRLAHAPAGGKRKSRDLAQVTDPIARGDGYFARSASCSWRWPSPGRFAPQPHARKANRRFKCVPRPSPAGGKNRPYCHTGRSAAAKGSPPA